MATSSEKYVIGLQSGEIELSQSAGRLEKSAFEKMQRQSAALKASVSQKKKAEEQIAQLNVVCVKLQQDIDTYVGQVAAYAELLAEAEVERSTAGGGNNGVKNPAEGDSTEVPNESA